jgi:glucose/arabinose dehydrogenase
MFERKKYYLHRTRKRILYMRPFPLTKLSPIIVYLLLLPILSISITSGGFHFPNVQAYIPVLRFAQDNGNPTVADAGLKTEMIAQGLELPTRMAFLGPNDILVLEKNNGTVQRIVDGQVSQQPLLDVNVATQVEEGMCGIAVSKNTPDTTYVFLYYTEAEGQDGGTPIGNRLYRYELVNNQLANPKLLLDLPATPGPRHNGGAIVIGPDKNLYVPIGDVDGHQSQAQNFKNRGPPDGTGGILRITQDGNPVGKDIIGSTSALKLYYAYGIRNSFGIDFDPVTGNLWDTENGPGFGDEINLVKPGFNSGWSKYQGIWIRAGGTDEGSNEGPALAPLQPDNLVVFDGKGVYRPPEFVWNHTVGPTAIKFFNSDKFGAQYRNEMFVGDVHKGNIYHFSLNQEREHLILVGSLAADKVAYTDEDLKDITFATGFGGITDLEVGPDGYLYVVSIGQGKIFRIVPEVGGGGSSKN